MLHYLVAIALLLAQVSAQSRYFVGLFQAAYNWAYPLDICVTTGIGTSKMMFTCVANDTKVKAVTYKDSTCTTASSTKVYSSSDTESNGTYAFSCNGTNDYVATELYLGGCSSPAGIVYTAINTCYKAKFINSSYDGYQQAECDATRTVASTYKYPGTSSTCDTATAVKTNESTLTTTCSYYHSSGTFKIYAKMINCVYNDYSAFPITKNSNLTNPIPSSPAQTINLTYVFWPNNTDDTNPDLCGVDWYSLFATIFSGSYVSVTTQCLPDHGIYSLYAGVWVGVEVSLSAATSDCAVINNTVLAEVGATIDTANYVVVNHTCIEATPTPAPTSPPSTPSPTFAPTLSSAGIIPAFNFIVLASSLLAAMYIL